MRTGLNLHVDPKALLPLFHPSILPSFRFFPALSSSTSLPKYGIVVS